MLIVNESKHFGTRKYAIRIQENRKVISSSDVQV